MDQKNSQAVYYDNFGKPNEVLRLGELPEADLKPGEARVRLLGASINPSDLGMVSGAYGRLKTLPAIGGREGLGIIEALADSETTLQVGDWVRMPEEHGAWRQSVQVEAEILSPVPNDLPLEQAIMATINPPTVIRLFSDFADLKPGDWIIQNAASSALGVLAIQYAKSKGIRTINIVRDLAWEVPLVEAGANCVLKEGSYDLEYLQVITEGQLPILGFNSVGGESVAQMMKVMAPGATLVTFGGMTSEKIRFPTRFLIFHDIKLVGFWMDKWIKEHSEEVVGAMYEEVYQLIRTGVFRVPVAQTYPFTEALTAIEQGLASSRKGKVLILNE